MVANPASSLCVIVHNSGPGCQCSRQMLPRRGNLDQQCFESVCSKVAVPRASPPPIADTSHPGPYDGKEYFEPIPPAANR